MLCMLMHSQQSVYFLYVNILLIHISISLSLRTSAHLTYLCRGLWVKTAGKMMESLCLTVSPECCWAAVPWCVGATVQPQHWFKQSCHLYSLSSILEIIKEAWWDQTTPINRAAPVFSATRRLSRSHKHTVHGSVTFIWHKSLVSHTGRCWKQSRGFFLCRMLEAVELVQ